jgi:hypothetical protein
MGGGKEKFPLSVTQAKQTKQGSKPTNKTNKQASQSASKRPHRRSRRSFEVGTGRWPHGNRQQQQSTAQHQQLQKEGERKKEGRQVGR